MALCEVAKSDGLKKHNENIWTHVTDAHVVTRMLFVYEDGGQNVSGVSVNTTQPGVVARINAATGEEGGAASAAAAAAAADVGISL